MKKCKPIFETFGKFQLQFKSSFSSDFLCKKQPNLKVQQFCTHNSFTKSGRYKMLVILIFCQKPMSSENSGHFVHIIIL
jgi:hypothetical protein